MTKNHAEQMRSIRRLSDSTAKMQDGLIITMADLVESRDSDTGAHVQKTAAYVKIIVEGLNKKGYYPGKITPKFMSDVVRSAPLHDIGKINIPDEVLNKPGKLTDEEFKTIKSHTVLGYDTLKGISIMPELAIGAGSHHERPDGRGYPKGLKGDEIPRVAQIIAVADTFDAMYSNRPYRKRMNFEKAVSIIKEVRGTQLQSDVVDAFLRLVNKGKFRAPDDFGGGTTDDINNIHKKQKEEDHK